MLCTQLLFYLHIMVRPPVDEPGCIWHTELLPDAWVMTQQWYDGALMGLLEGHKPWPAVKGG
jgi:hypothetical protein